jgi:TolB-like protein
MYTGQNLAESELIPENIVLKQVEKILAHPLFVVSETLRKFLSYIVKETLSGRVDQIKEYTIAVYGLNKPSDFKPIVDGVVRVHASRLRFALNSYYSNQGAGDLCEISIPKGNYIPVFKSLKPNHIGSVVQTISNPQNEHNDKMRIAIMPFKSYEKSSERLAFTENIGQMISAEFVRFPNFEILSYRTTRQIKTETRSVKSIGSEYNVQFLMYGNIYFDSTRIRIVIEFVDAFTEILIWSNKYTHVFIAADLFEMEDIIVHQVTTAFKEFVDRIGLRFFEQLPIAEHAETPEQETISISLNHRSKKIVSF